MEDSTRYLREKAPLTWLRPKAIQWHAWYVSIVPSPPKLCSCSCSEHASLHPQVLNRTRGSSTGMYIIINNKPTEPHHYTVGLSEQRRLHLLLLLALTFLNTLYVNVLYMCTLITLLVIISPQWSTVKRGSPSPFYRGNGYPYFHEMVPIIGKMGIPGKMGMGVPDFGGPHFPMTRWTVCERS